MDLQRLDKILASTGKWSRREIKQMARQGRILANGTPVSSAEQKYDPQRTDFIVDGEEVCYRSVTWLMMNKPGGVLSATEDGRGTTVLDLLPAELQKQGLFPVGRLDKDTEGLLLLTNDGALAHRLLSPKHHVDKLYEVKVNGCLTEEDCRAFREGMVLGDGLHCLPAELEILEAGDVSFARVILREGKFHQIKRMLAARGKPVLFLRRVEMGNLPLDPALKLGEFRFLTPQELDILQKF